MRLRGARFMCAKTGNERAESEMNYENARKAMVDNQIRPNDVTDKRLLSVLESIPKERFLPTELRAVAYVEKEIAVSETHALPAPRDFAKLLQELDIKPHELVLDVACGTGYSTAVLAKLSEMVVAVEGDETVAARAEKTLVDLDIGNAAVIAGEPVKGAEKQGPFDAIVIAGVVEEIPSALFDQLKDGGRLGALHLRDGVARGVIYQRDGDAVSSSNRFHAASKRTATGFQKEKTFVF